MCSNGRSDNISSGSAQLLPDSTPDYTRPSANHGVIAPPGTTPIRHPQQDSVQSSTTCLDDSCMNDDDAEYSDESFEDWLTTPTGQLFLAFMEELPFLAEREDEDESGPHQEEDILMPKPSAVRTPRPGEIGYPPKWLEPWLDKSLRTAFFRPDPEIWGDDWSEEESDSGLEVAPSTGPLVVGHSDLQVEEESDENRSDKDTKLKKDSEGSLSTDSKKE